MIVTVNPHRASAFKKHHYYLAHIIAEKSHKNCGVFRILKVSSLFTICQQAASISNDDLHLDLAFALRVERAYWLPDWKKWERVYW